MSRSLRGAAKERPPHATEVPSWDFTVVLEALCSPLFEPLQRSDLKWLSVKTAFILAVMSAKRVGELQALSVARDCLRWTSDGLEVTMRTNPAFLHEWFSDIRVNQPIGLPAYAPQPGTEGLQPDSGLLCPIRAVRRYVYATSVAEVGCTVSVMGHTEGVPCVKAPTGWLMLSCRPYEYKGLPVPPVKCHSARSVSISWALRVFH